MPAQFRRQSARSAQTARSLTALLTKPIRATQPGQSALRFHPRHPGRMYRDNDPNRIGRYDSYGRRYLVDVTLKF